MFLYFTRHTLFYSLGNFIVLEGTDGSGKSTLASFLQKEFSPEKLTVTQAFASPIASKVKPLLISDEATMASVESRFLLSFAAHVDHVTNTALPLLDTGVSVVSDRFDASNFAYQVYGESALHLAPLFWELRTQLLSTHVPDLYIFLDVPPEKGLERATQTGKILDFVEKRGGPYHERVREGYVEFFKNVPHIVIDANRPLEAVQQEVLAIVQEHTR